MLSPRSPSNVRFILQISIRLIARQAGLGNLTWPLRECPSLRLQDPRQHSARPVPVHHSAVNRCQIRVKVGNSIQQFGLSKYLLWRASWQSLPRSLHLRRVPLPRGHPPSPISQPAVLGLNHDDGLKFVLENRVLLHLLWPFLLQMSFERTKFGAGLRATPENLVLLEKLLLQEKQRSGPKGSMGASWWAVVASPEVSEILRSGYRGCCDLNTLILIKGLRD